MEQTLRTQLREAYDRTAREREAASIEPWKSEERAQFLQRLREERKRTLLELGAGPGRDSKFFQDNGLAVVCTDLSPAMVELCRQKGLAAHVMDFGNLQLPAGSFDAVYALNCLLHLPKHELPPVLRTIETLLTPNGLFYMGVYGGYDFEGIWEQDTYEPSASSHSSRTTTSSKSSNPSLTYCHSNALC